MLLTRGSSALPSVLLFAVICRSFIGDGLSDFKDALVQCNETILVKDLIKFIADLVACTEGGCIVCYC